MTASMAAACLTLAALVEASGNASAVPGNVVVDVYYPTQTGEQVVDASPGETANFSVEIVVTASSTGFREFHVTVSLRYEIVVGGLDSPPAEGWAITQSVASLTMTVTPRGTEEVPFLVDGSVTAADNATLEPDFHTFYSAASDAPLTSPGSEQETSLSLILNVNGTGASPESRGRDSGTGFDLGFLTVVGVTTLVCVLGGVLLLAWRRPEGAVGKAVKAASLTARRLIGRLRRSSALKPP